MFNLEKQRVYIQDLMTKLSFPTDAQTTFLNALDTVSANEAAAASFLSLLQQYDESENCPYKQMLAQIKDLGEAVGIHEYTAAMLLFLCMAERLHSRYIERGIDEGVWLNSLLDLRYKLTECRLIHGIDGTFVSWWFPDCFNLTRFALGRLQFEIVTLTDDYVISDTKIPAGSKAINMHIPRTETKLEHNEVLESYRLAAEMFADEFKDEPMVFVCSSWLLDPWNLTVLPPTSNLVAFYNDFKIVEATKYKDYNSVWPVFDCLYTGDPKKLPRNTTLRRAYAERIERGEPVGTAKGLFIYKDGKILNK